MIFFLRNLLIRLFTWVLNFCCVPLSCWPCYDSGIAVAQQPAHPGSIQTIDRIVAVVNENVVTRHELDERLRTTVKQLQKQGVQPPEPAVLEKQLLERIIVNRVQLQLAKETGLTVSDAELDQTLRRIAQENKIVIAGILYCA